MLVKKRIGFVILFYPNEYILLYPWFYLILLIKTTSMVSVADFRGNSYILQFIICTLRLKGQYIVKMFRVIIRINN